MIYIYLLFLSIYVYTCIGDNMITIKDVAKLANVSVATVSRVINNTGYVNIETRKIVEKAIDELGYVPNELARSLFKKKSKIIGLVVPHFDTYYFAELIQAIESEVASKGYNLMVFNSKDDPEKEKANLKIFQQYNIDGLILCVDTQVVDAYKQIRKPIITIDRKISDDIPSVTCNNIQGGELAALEFVNAKCRNIIHITGPDHLESVVDRAYGFKEVLNQHGLSANYLSVDYTRPNMNRIKDFLSTYKKTDCIFCSSDDIALRLIHLLSEENIRVPDDIKVIGYDDIAVSEFSVPSLSTIEQPLESLGKVSVEMILKLINKEAIENLHVTLPVKYIKRKSL
jgi:LacI family transcriptional regulator